MEWGLVLVTAVVNGAVMWGVIRTEFKYLRRDIDNAHRRLDIIERRRVRT